MSLPDLVGSRITPRLASPALLLERNDITGVGTGRVFQNNGHPASGCSRAETGIGFRLSPCREAVLAIARCQRELSCELFPGSRQASDRPSDRSPQ